MVVSEDEVDNDLHDANEKDKDDRSEKLTDISTNGSELEG